LFHAQLPPLLHIEDDVEVVFFKRTFFTAASSSEEALSLDYDDDSEMHYKFTAFGRWKLHIKQPFPYYTPDTFLRSMDTSVWICYWWQRSVKKCVFCRLES
jgi:hypothetical protein